MEPPSSPSIDIRNTSMVRVRTDKLRAGMVAALRSHGLEGGVSVLLCTDEEIADLNAQYRGADGPTDVLTFVYGDADVLGDVAISVPCAARQAKARGVSLAQELAYLGIHGALHLVGFDDETEDEWRTMIEQMNLAAASAGLKPDYGWSSLASAKAVL